MNTNLYLKRIHYQGELSPTLEVLSLLQKAHLLSVPFENLAIHYNIKIDLEHSYDKIVLENKGGFCYELNGLFYQLLTTLGFNVKMISARVFANEGYGPEFDHMAIVATINNDKYLVDVGFGEFAFYPLLIQEHLELKDPRGLFKMEATEENEWIVRKKNAHGDFIPEYLFSEKERQVDEFLPMCHYHQTSTESHFTHKLICSLPTTEGRITLTGNKLKITTYDTISEKQVTTQSEVQQILREHFNINYTKASR